MIYNGFSFWYGDLAIPNSPLGSFQRCLVLFHDPMLHRMLSHNLYSTTLAACINRPKQGGFFLFSAIYFVNFCKLSRKSEKIRHFEAKKTPEIGERMGGKRIGNGRNESRGPQRLEVTK